MLCCATNAHTRFKRCTEADAIRASVLRSEQELQKLEGQR